MSATPTHYLSEYINRDGEPVAMIEAEHILAELEDVALGIKMLCDIRITNHASSPDETATLRLIGCGVSKILDGLCRTMPTREKHNDISQ